MIILKNPLYYTGITAWKNRSGCQNPCVGMTQKELKAHLEKVRLMKQQRLSRITARVVTSRNHIGPIMEPKFDTSKARYEKSSKLSQSALRQLVNAGC